MARLTWDETGKHFFETGDDHAVLYPQSDDGSYPLGVAWNGITGVTDSPSGAEATSLYADNIKYATIRSAETHGGTIEAYTYPEEWEECDGSKQAAAGISIGQQSRKAFGFCYRSLIGSDTYPDGDAGYKLHLIYNATASPSEKARSTVNDSPDALTFSWDYEATPVPCTGYKNCSTIDIDSTKASAASLKELEDILYGNESDDPRLPLPDEVISLFSGN